MFAKIIFPIASRLTSWQTAGIMQLRTENCFFTSDGRRWTQIRADVLALSGYGIERHILAILSAFSADCFISWPEMYRAGCDSLWIPGLSECSGKHNSSLIRISSTYIPAFICVNPCKKDLFLRPKEQHEWTPCVPRSSIRPSLNVEGILESIV